MIAMYSRWQSGEVECVPNSKLAEGRWKLVMHMAVLWYQAYILYVGLQLQGAL